MNKLRNTPILKGHIYKLPKFETLEKSTQENETRYWALERDRRNASLELSKRLQFCTHLGVRCGSPACKICAREYRARVVEELVELYERYKTAAGYKFLTVALYDQVTDRCRDVDTQRLKDRYRKAIQRAGIEYPVIGSIEMDYDANRELWEPHLHMLVPTSDEQKYERLVNTLKKAQLKADGRENKRPRPVVTKEIRDGEAVNAISYIFKFMWLKLPDGEYEKKGRIPQLQLCNYLLYVDKLGFNQLMVMYRARIEGGRLKLKCP